MMIRLTFICICLCLIWTCQSGSNSERSTDDNPISQANVATQPALPGITNEDGTFLWDSCDYVDLLFYNLPFSMSIDNQAGIRSNLRMISNETVIQNAACQPMGRIFYQKDAVNVMEADIFYGSGCNYFVFYKNNEPVYANKMTPEAVQYFTNIINKVSVQ